MKGRILDTARWPKRRGADERAARLAFRAPLYRASNSASPTGELRWGDDVEILSRGKRRTKVRTPAGAVGWVEHAHVAEVRRLGARYVAPLWRNAQPTPKEQKIFDLLETKKYPHGDGEIDLCIYARDAERLPKEFRKDAEAKKNARSVVFYEETPAGALNPQSRERSFRNVAIVSGIVYGLVNVRTDGSTILCATRNESENGWNVRTFVSRF